MVYKGQHDGGGEVVVLPFQNGQWKMYMDVEAVVALLVTIAQNSGKVMDCRWNMLGGHGSNY